MGYPVQSVHVEVDLDNCDISVNTTPAAIRTCASAALNKAMREAQPVLLEPVMQVIIDLPDGYAFIDFEFFFF